MTKEEAIDISIELWTWLAESGAIKEEWDGWKKYGHMSCECPLCEYDYQHLGGCHSCPLARISGNYHNLGCYDTAFNDWENADTSESRKKYAKEFLEQLKELKEK